MSSIVANVRCRRKKKKPFDASKVPTLLRRIREINSHNPPTQKSASCTLFLNSMRSHYQDERV
jgi:hypothetical protein